jgi:hypothetical protein
MLGWLHMMSSSFTKLKNKPSGMKTLKAHIRLINWQTKSKSLAVVG